MSEKKWVWREPSWIAPHIRRYLEDPESGHMWDSTKAGGPGMLPTLLLTTTGRRSGEPRMSPLLYCRVGDEVAVIASKGGYPDHPAWYLNLVEDPNCEVRVSTDRFRARARVTKGAEREAIWQQMEQMYPPFAEYQARAEREIPVLVLERIP